jgi:hypothetical protein
MAKSTSLLFYPGLKYLNCNNSVNNVLEMLWTLLISKALLYNHLLMATFHL